MASLMTFAPSDPSWSQTAWHEPIAQYRRRCRRLDGRYVVLCLWRTGLCHSSDHGDPMLGGLP
ncbi:hypothetical protein [Edwardsiella ictaluri]|uniref:hypothetical protein n=1 Tax=Edwardsiella ictaluri TaxID=67780 RepID=UPI0039F711DE